MTVDDEDEVSALVSVADMDSVVEALGVSVPDWVGIDDDDVVNEWVTVADAAMPDGAGVDDDDL